MTEKFICFPFFNVRITVSHCVYDLNSWESGSNNAVKHMLAKWTERKSLSHTLLTRSILLRYCQKAQQKL